MRSQYCSGCLLWRPCGIAAVGSMPPIKPQTRGPIAAPSPAPVSRSCSSPPSVDPRVVVRKEQANKNQQNGYRYGQERCDEKAGYRCQNIADGVDDAAASVVGYNRRYRVTSYNHRGILDQLPSTSERSANRQAHVTRGRARATRYSTA